MKRMSKFIFGIIFSIFMMGIISCSGQDESTNLTIAIDMSGLLPSNESKDSFARSVDDEKWKLEVTLIDLEDENNILPPISVPIIDDKASVTFEKIPLFFKGRIEAIIFEGETPKYTGKSEEFIVHEGRNRISVHLEKVDNPTEPGDPEDPADPNDPNQPGDGTGEGSGETGGDNPTEPDDPEDPADPNDPNQPGDGTGEGSGETGGDDPTEPDDPEDPNDPNQPGDGTGEGSGETGGDNPTDPGNPGDDPEIGETEKTAKYTVKHYQQNIDDDEYTLVETDTEEKTGIVGAETSAEAKKYEGFEVYSVEQKTIAEDGTTEVQIKYNRKVITLTFDTKGGSSVESIIGRYGATVVAPENPTKNGYTFTAWNPTLPETFPSADSEYKATWTKEGDYTITYNLDGGTNANENPISYNVETETITLKEPTKIGYSFEGWYKGEEKITQITKGSIGNIILTAVWKANTYTVVFNPGVDDGSVNGEMNSLPCTYDVPNELLKNEFTRENFDFNGWKDAYGTEYKDCASVENLASTQNAVVTLYAQWHPQSKVRDVDFSVAGGDVNYGTKVTLSCETAGATIYYKEGNAEDFSEYNGEIEIKNDVTITAYATKEGMVDADYITKTFTLKKYTVTLNYNNETEETTVEVTSGSTYTLPTEVTRTGYTFDGWDLDGKIVNTVTVTNANIELTATWTPITYTVVFNANGGKTLPAEQSQIFTYDESKNLTPNVFTREGYAFNGWNKNADGSGTSYTDKENVINLSATKDAVVTLYAQWKKTSVEVSPPSFTEDPVSINKTIGYDNKITFTVEGLEGISNPSFTWYIDDEVVANESALTIDPNNTEYLAGTYSIRVIVTDETGNVYSAMYDFELIK